MLAEESKRSDLAAFASHLSSEDISLPSAEST